MLDSSRRISKSLFPEIISRGKVFFGKNSSLRVMPAEKTMPTAFAFVVAAKTAKTAVERHFLKRRGRHAIKKNLSVIKGGYYCIFFFRPGLAKLNFPAFEQEILNGLKAAGLVK